MTPTPHDVMRTSSLLYPPPRFTEIVADAPRLASQARQLEADRRALLEALRSADLSDPVAARQLRDRLDRWRQRTADLLYQAYQVDLGGET